MTVKELMKQLKKMDQNAEIILVCESDGVGIVESLEGICMNGECVQFNGDGFSESCERGGE